jgi:hypothetical protein
MKMSLTKKSKPSKAFALPKARSAATSRKSTQRQESIRDDEQESVLSIVAQWQREKPKFDTGPMALFGALARAYLLTSPVIESFILKHGIARGMFDVLTALRRAGPPFAYHRPSYRGR